MLEFAGCEVDIILIVKRLGCVSVQDTVYRRQIPIYLESYIPIYLYRYLGIYISRSYRLNPQIPRYLACNILDITMNLGG
jgi:hypothetical protein